MDADSSTTDVTFYASELTRSGGLSWFRNHNTQPAILGPFFGTTITAPSMYTAGTAAGSQRTPPVIPGLALSTRREIVVAQEPGIFAEVGAEARRGRQRLATLRA
jgi:hypothetical protein